MKHYDLLRGRSLIFLTSIIIFSLMFFLTSVYNMKLLNINANNYFTPDAREFILEVVKEDKVSKLFDTIQGCDIVSVKTAEDFVFYYFNDSAKYRPDIKIKQVASTSGHGVLLGREKYDDFRKSGDNGFLIEGKSGATIKGNVVGVLENSRFDFKAQSYYLLMNFNDEIKYFNGVYLIEGKGSYKDFQELEREGIIKIVPLEFANFDTSGDEFFQVKLFFFVGAIILLGVVLTLVSKLWLGVYIEELRVRKLSGANNNLAIIQIGLKYFIVIYLGVAIGIFIYLLYVYIVLGADYHWSNALIWYH